MTSYTTLGEGKSVKVLRTAPYVPAETVTTCPADLARPLARALERVTRGIAAALYPVAVHYDAREPVAARRLLLAQFDLIAHEPGYVSRTDHWQLCDGLLIRLTDALRGAPTAVLTAARTELARHLDGFDDVLVPARISTVGYKRMWLDVCASAALDAVDLGYALAHGDLEEVADDPVFPTGGVCVTSSDFYGIVDALYDADPAGAAWASGFDVADLVAAAVETSMVEVGIRRDHLRAWLVRHHPEDIDRFDAIATI